MTVPWSNWLTAGDPNAGIGHSLLSPAPLPPMPYQPKASIVDRVLGRLFPTAGYEGLLAPADMRGLQQQGLLNIGSSLLRAGGPQPVQQGFLANLGGALQQSRMDFPAMATQALQLQAYQSQVVKQRAIAQVAAQHPAQPGETPQQRYDRQVAILNDILAIPGATADAENYAKVVAATKPEKAGEPQKLSGILQTNPKLPYFGKTVTALVPYPGAPRELWTYAQEAPKDKEPTPVERLAGSQADSAAESVAAMREIAQRNKPAALAAVAAIKAGGWGKLGKAYSELRGFTNDPDAQNFFTQYNNALLSFSPLYGGTRTTQQILDLEKAATLPALGSGDFNTAFMHLERRIKDLRAKAGKAASPVIPKAQGGYSADNPFATRP
jgi:hypothetical protein